MSKSDPEIRELVLEIERGWDRVRDKFRKNQAQLYMHDSYADELIKALDVTITTRVPIPSAIPDHDAFTTEGILRQSFAFHVEPKPGKGERSPAVQRADKAELFYAHAWALKFDADSAISDPTHRYQVVGPAAFWWLDWEGFALPKEEAKREEYRRSYWPFKLSVLDPLTVGMLPDDRGQPTIAARHFDMPYVQIAKTYGEATDANALSVLGRMFPGLRGARGRAVDEGDLWTKKLEVWVVDDLNTVCTYVKMPGTERGKPHYEQVTEDYKNPWGGSSLTVVTGRYNADAIDLEDRYVGLIDAEMKSQRTLDVMDSHIGSIALTPSKWGEQLPEEVAKMLADGQKIEPPEFGDGGIARLLGTLAELKTSLPDDVKELRATRTADRDITRPPPYLTNPDETLVRNATAAAQLNAQETSNRNYDAARKSKINGVKTVMKKIEYAIMCGFALSMPSFKDEKIIIRLSGKEPTKEYKGGRKDEELEIGPDDFEEGDVLEINPTASSQSQKAMEFDLKSTQQAGGWVTHDQVLETITENVSQQKEMLEEEARYQQYGPLIDNADLMAFVEVLRMESSGPDGSGGMDLSQLLVSLLGQGGAPLAPGPQNDPSIAVNATVPPPTGVPDVGVQG